MPWKLSGQIDPDKDAATLTADFLNAQNVVVFTYSQRVTLNSTADVDKFVADAKAARTSTAQRQTQLNNYLSQIETKLNT